MGGGHINPFDAGVLHFFNQFAQRSPLADTLIAFVSNHMLFKGTVVMALFWWQWFSPRPSQARDRELLLSGIAMSVLTLVIARTLALSLPFRERPRHVPALHFRVPLASSDFHVIHWSSFPSDNAALFFSLATCLFFVSRKVGLFAYCHALFLVCLPRIYLGLHYPTDILGGALLGIGVASLSLNNRLREWIVRRPLWYLRNCPDLFYACFFAGTLLLATEFEPVRSVLVAGWKIAHGSVPNIP
jgi:membrane-associated phospholipid phosphatase